MAPPPPRGREAPARNVLGPWTLDTVHNVDCARALRALPNDCLDLVITSPPYWGQRRAGGLGTEADPRDYVANLTAVLADSMRCLKPTGTLWLNVGDAYNTPINWREGDHVYSSLGAHSSTFPIDLPMECIRAAEPGLVWIIEIDKLTPDALNPKLAAGADGISLSWQGAGSVR